MKTKVWQERRFSVTNIYKLYIGADCKDRGANQAEHEHSTCGVEQWSFGVLSHAFRDFSARAPMRTFVRRNSFYVIQTSELCIKVTCLYLMFLSSKNLVRHFWMMWSTKSDSRIRFSDCLSFSKDFTWAQWISECDFMDRPDHKTNYYSAVV